MKKLLIASAVLALAGSAVLGQENPIAARKAAMKAVGGAFYGEMGKMNKGETPYDQAKVLADLKKISEIAKTLPALYPDNSKTGGDTAALPKIWDNKADFDARYAKLGKEAEEAAGKITDEASFKDNFTAINKNCGGCHETYRAKKS